MSIADLVHAVMGVSFGKRMEPRLLSEIRTQALRETGEKRCRRPLKQQKRTPHLTPTRHRNTTLNILRHQATAPPLRIRHSINSSSASSGEMSASRVRLM